MGFEFPLGEYHATPWDRAVNSGDSEWPPSPWRILRALLSVWHTRCPDIDLQTVESVIGKLASEPPSYLLPETFPSHTRHYLPGASHSEVSRDTAYTLAPRLQLAPKSQVLVRWPTVELDAHERDSLERLLQGLPTWAGLSRSATRLSWIRCLPRSPTTGGACQTRRAPRSESWCQLPGSLARSSR
ncbi:MAG: type I-U CRISPR-associated protein Cas5/Cas6 [Actinomycetales bacterium]|uniref:Type I-U CRISPR-associated protein Cas5/Cas6 n=1 Tax=Candidatus Phosphoribacter hodrii TaxID=2953743 RepID=A0A9D7T640_9MICO|nr:type I-U CRISPR-associated protein Cas5/Cas6 [Candidatus Phosphoribacter hodrii]